MSKKNGYQKNNRRAKRGLKPNFTFFCLDASYTSSLDPAAADIQKIIDRGDAS